MALDKPAERGLVGGQHAVNDFAVLLDANRPLPIVASAWKKVAVEPGLPDGFVEGNGFAPSLRARVQIKVGPPQMTFRWGYCRTLLKAAFEINETSADLPLPTYHSLSRQERSSTKKSSSLRNKTVSPSVETVFHSRELSPL